MATQRCWFQSAKGSKGRIDRSQWYRQEHIFENSSWLNVEMGELDTISIIATWWSIVRYLKDSAYFWSSEEFITLLKCIKQYDILDFRGIWRLKQVTSKYCWSFRCTIDVHPPSMVSTKIPRCIYRETTTRHGATWHGECVNDRMECLTLRPLENSSVWQIPQIKDIPTYILNLC